MIIKVCHHPHDIPHTHGVLLNEAGGVFLRRSSRFTYKNLNPIVVVDQHDDFGSGVLWSGQPRSSPNRPSCLGIVENGNDVVDESPSVWILRKRRWDTCL